jgi:ABC-type transporter MlaC component
MALMRCAGVVLVGGLLCFGAGSLPAAEETGDPALARTQIRETSDKVLALFRKRDLFRPEKADELLVQLHAILDERFDWPTIARWVLATNRPLFGDAQVGEFATLFGDYVVLYYLIQVEQHITGDDPALVDQIQVDYRDGKRRDDGSLAIEVVFTTPKKTQVTTGYTMVYDRGPQAWRVRNFIVEGVSLVRNWRTELAPVKSREKIMELLQAKAKELRDQRSGASAKP